MPDGKKEPVAANGEPGTTVRAPLAATLNTVTVLLNWLLTKRLLSSGLSTPTLELTPGPRKGEPGIVDRAPLEAMLKTATWLPPPLASAAKMWLLLQSQSTPVALPVPPAGKGEPATAVSAPVAEMLNMDTVSVAGRATARNLPSGVTLMPSGDPPAPPGNGEPATWARAPLAAM